MLSTKRLISQRSESPQSDLDELRTDSLNLIAPSLIAAGAAAIVSTGVSAGVLPRETWMVGVALAGTGLVVHRELRHDAGIWPATMILVVGLCSTITGAIFLYSGVPVSVLFCLVVVLVAALHGLRASLGMAVLVSGLIAVLTWTPVNVLSSGVAVVTLILVWTAVYTSWLASRPLQMALTWYGQSYDQALEVTQEARARQGELGRLSKSLGEACASLELLARDLDHARQTAEDARRLKAQFAMAVSHELRTPLNLIIGFSEMMVITPRSSYGQPLPPRYFTDIEAIYRNACHISSLIDDILDLGQIDAERMGVRRQEASVSQIVQTAIAGLAPRIQTQGLTLDLDVPEDLPTVLVDPTRIRQVLINLLINAVRFTDAGEITITARRGEDAHDVLMSVADTGVGIPADDVPHVFDEFSQSGEPGRRRGGSGLGLTVSKRFVELHGGNMWATSKLGLGSTFYFTIPLCENIVTSPYTSRVSTDALPAVTLTGRAVVAIDPTGDTSRVLGRYLDGYSVVRAGNAERARQLADEGTACAVIVDSLQTQENWYRLNLGSDRLRRLPVVVCPLHNVRSIARDLGAVEYLVKPVRRDRLRAALRTVFTSNKAAASRRAHGDHLAEGRRTVLITEDDPEMMRLLGQMIRSYSKRYEVWTARDGAECLERLHQCRPDLLILDLLMPGVDGYGVLERVRADERYNGLPIVVISAKSQEEERVVADTVSVSRADGLSVAEAVRCLKVNLDVLTDGPIGNLSEQPVGSAG